MFGSSIHIADERYYPCFIGYPINRKAVTSRLIYQK
jgi:hypothetical protein